MQFIQQQQDQQERKLTLLEEKEQEQEQAMVMGLDGDLDEECRTVKLVTSDGSQFSLPAEYCRISVICANVLDNGGQKSSNDSVIIPIPSTHTTDSIAVIHHLLNMLKGVAVLPDMPVKSRNLVDSLEERKDIAAYVDQLTHIQIHNLIMCSVFLGIDCLMHIGCAKVATFLKNKPIAEHKAILSQFDLPSRNQMP